MPLRKFFVSHLEVGDELERLNVTTFIMGGFKNFFLKKGVKNKEVLI